MAKERLHETLDELHRELERGDAPIDEDTREHLRATMDDIRRRLAGEDPAQEESVGDRLQESFWRFQSEHPVTAAGIKRLIDLLNQTGI